MENKVTNTNNIKEAFELPHKVFTEPFDLARINHELGEKAEEGKLIGLRQDKNEIVLAEPSINGIWVMCLNEKGYIKKIVLF